MPSEPGKNLPGGAGGWPGQGGDLYEVLARLDAAGAARYVVTDITKDGTMRGPNLDLLREVCARTDAPPVVTDGPLLRLSLDADVSAYVGFPVRHPRLPAPITLRHLLTHTAALADREETRAPGGPALGDFLGGYFADAGARAVFLDAGPGTTMAYSNVGPSLAALAVERASGTRFADRARERVFAPLGMRATAFGQDALPAGSRVAAPYAARGDGFVRLSPPSHVLYPVVDLFSTPRDLARFARAIARGGELDDVRILSAPSVSEMLRVQLPDAAPGEALGWQARTFGGRSVVGHEGEDSGVSTGLYLDPTSGSGAIVLANGDAFQGDDGERAAAIGGLLEELLGAARSSATRESRIRSPDGD